MKIKQKNSFAWNSLILKGKTSVYLISQYWYIQMMNHPKANDKIKIRIPVVKTYC